MAKPLTERELNVLQRCAQGDSYQQVARRLYLSHSTVSIHLQHARRKLGAQNTAHAVAIALREGLIE